MRVVPLPEYMKMERPKLSWTVHGLLPKPGMILLVGKPKAGKSYLALDLACAVAEGRMFLGHLTTPGNVLYLQLDTSELIWRDRLEKLDASGYGLPKNVFMTHPEDTPRPFNLLTESARVFVRDAIRQAQPTLVIVDVLRKAHSSDENDSTSMKNVSDVLDVLFEGLSVILVHHTKKLDDVFEPESGEERVPDPMMAARGSNFMMGQVEAVWLLHKGKLRIESRFDEKQTLSVVQTSTGIFQILEPQTMQEQRARAMSLCHEFPGKRHAELCVIAHERWRMSRATYYRQMAGLACPHVASAASVPLAPGTVTPNDRLSDSRLAQIPALSSQRRGETPA